MNNYPHIAARLFNMPLLIHPQKLDAIIAGLGQRILGAPMQQQGDDASHNVPGMYSTRRGEVADRGYKVVDGVAVISTSGALVHRSKFLIADSSFLQGYNDISADLEDAMRNPDVHAVLQVFDTPGGEAQGAFECADRSFALRGQKPFIAICDGMAASAGYLTASAADEVVVTNTGYAGSIGVVMRHVDFSRAMANDGVTVTHIFAGAHKVDGNPFEPLPESVRKDFQAEIDGLMTMFVDNVARQRGLSADAIRNTQARVFQGVAAVAAGLADRIGTTDQLIQELAAQRARIHPVGPAARSTAIDNKGVPHMSGTNTGGNQAATTTQAQANAPAITQEQLDAARADGHKAGHDAGVQAERTRVSGIFAHEAAAGRTALAIQCVSTGLSVEQAGAILGASPVAAAATASAQTPFTAAMANLGNPDVSGITGAKAEGAAESDAAIAAQIVATARIGR